MLGSPARATGQERPRPGVRDGVQVKRVGQVLGPIEAQEVPTKEQALVKLAPCSRDTLTSASDLVAKAGLQSTPTPGGVLPTPGGVPPPQREHPPTPEGAPPYPRRSALLPQGECPTTPGGARSWRQGGCGPGPRSDVVLSP